MGEDQTGQPDKGIGKRLEKIASLHVIPDQLD